MLRLAAILYSIIGTSMAGIGVIAVLSMGLVSTSAIITSAAIGAVLALPVSYFVAGKILALTSK